MVTFENLNRKWVEHQYAKFARQEQARVKRQREFSSPLRDAWLTTHGKVV